MPTRAIPRFPAPWLPSCRAWFPCTISIPNRPASSAISRILETPGTPAAFSKPRSCRRTWSRSTTWAPCTQHHWTEPDRASRSLGAATSTWRTCAPSERNSDCRPMIRRSSSTARTLASSAAGTRPKRILMSSGRAPWRRRRPSSSLSPRPPWPAMGSTSRPNTL